MNRLWYGGIDQKTSNGRATCTYNSSTNIARHRHANANAISMIMMIWKAARLLIKHRSYCVSALVYKSVLRLLFSGLVTLLFHVTPRTLALLELFFHVRKYMQISVLSIRKWIFIERDKTSASTSRVIYWIQLQKNLIDTLKNTAMRFGVYAFL